MNPPFTDQSEPEPFWDLEIEYHLLKNSTFRFSRAEVEDTIRHIKEHFKVFLITPEKLIGILGYAYEKFLSNRQDICTEIKKALAEEITVHLISKRQIERYCLSEWKKKTKPKKNDKLSFCAGSITHESKRVAERAELTSIGVDGAQNASTKDNIEIKILGPLSSTEQLEGLKESKKNILTFSFPTSIEELRCQTEKMYERVHGKGNIWLCWKLNSVTEQITEFRITYRAFFHEYFYGAKSECN